MEKKFEKNILDAHEMDMILHPERYEEPEEIPEYKRRYSKEHIKKRWL